MSSRAVPLAAALLVALAAPTAAKAAALPPPTIMISSPVVNEGDAGMTKFTAMVSYQTYGSIGGPGTIEVDITAMPGTATAPDFVFTPVHLTLTAGVGPQEIAGYVVGDKVFEGDESFTLVAKATPGGYYWSQGGVVTITDDDQTDAPKLNIVPTTVVPEGFEQHTVNVQVSLQPAVTHEVSVVFGTGNSDSTTFKGTMGVLKFAPGQTSATIPVDVFGNSYWNIDKTFTIGLSQPQGALIGNATGTVVLDNDDPPTVLSMSDVSVVEGTGGTKKAELEIHLDPPAPPNSKIWLTVTGGAAKLGEDYDGQPFQVLYPLGGETVMKASFDIVGDAVHECSEGLVLQYQAVYMGDDTARTAKLLITDDDAGEPGSASAAGCIDPYTGPPPPRDPTTPVDPTGMAGASGSSGMAGASGGSGEAGAPGGSGMAGAKGGTGMAGAPATAGAAGTGGATSGAAGTSGAPGAGNEGNDERLGSRGGCSIAPTDAPVAPLGGLVLLALALTVGKRRRRR
jgi:MYXO-CTERM domain-containing protein